MTLATRILLFGLISTAGSARGQEILLEFAGDSANDYFGSVGGAGDVDGDGTPDLVIGARLDDTTTHDNGSVRVYSGSTGALLHLFHGPGSYAYFGLAVAGAGDVDNDGFADVIAGAPYHDTTAGVDSGSAWVHSGLTGAVLLGLTSSGAADKFGFAVDAIGDADQDGFDDVVVGAPSTNDQGDNSGSAQVFSGKTGAELFRFAGAAPQDRLGLSVGRAGDVDGDGYPELIAGAPHHDASGVDAGAAYLYSTRDGSLVRQFLGVHPGDQAGAWVSGAGDVDGDGKPDVVVTALFDGPGGGVEPGSARVFAGSDGTLLHTWYGEQHGDLFGYRAAVVGDADGDGTPDVAVGAIWAQGVAVHVGSVSLFSGATGEVVFRTYGSAPYDHHGRVDAVGDVNGDGLADLLVGIQGGDGGMVDTGVARVYSGCTACLFESFGTGCPGSNAKIPKLSLSGHATAGGDVTMTLLGGVAGKTAFVLFGAQPASAPLGTGCTLLVGPAVGAVGPIPLIALGGAFTINGPIPATVVPGTIAFQAVTIDPAAPLGFATSNGVTMKIL